MNRAPAVTEPSPVRSGGASFGRIRCRKNAEPRKDSASATIANGRQDLHEEAADTRAADERQCPAGVDQRVALDVLVLRHHGDEQRRVRDGEQHGERALREGHREELRQRQHVQRVAHRQRDEQREPAEIGGDHGAPPPATVVHPRARVQAEQQAWQPDQRSQVTHLGCAGVQHQDGGQRNGDAGDLVPEHRDRLAAPVPPELGLPEQRGDPARQLPVHRPP